MDIDGRLRTWLYQEALTELAGEFADEFDELRTRYGRDADYDETPSDWEYKAKAELRDRHPDPWLEIYGRRLAENGLNPPLAVRRWQGEAPTSTTGPQVTDEMVSRGVVAGAAALASTGLVHALRHLGPVPPQELDDDPEGMAAWRVEMWHGFLAGPAAGTSFAARLPGSLACNGHSGQVIRPPDGQSPRVTCRICAGLVKFYAEEYAVQPREGETHWQALLRTRAEAVNGTEPGSLAGEIREVVEDLQAQLLRVSQELNDELAAKAGLLTQVRSMGGKIAALAKERDRANALLAECGQQRAAAIRRAAEAEQAQRETRAAAGKLLAEADAKAARIIAAVTFSAAGTTGQDWLTRTLEVSRELVGYARSGQLVVTTHSSPDGSVLLTAELFPSKP